MQPEATHLIVQCIDIGAIVSRQCHHVHPLHIALPQAHDIELIMPLGGEIGQPVFLGDQLQLPGIEVKGPLCRQIGHGIADITDIGNTAHVVLLVPRN